MPFGALSHVSGPGRIPHSAFRLVSIKLAVLLVCLVATCAIPEADASPGSLERGFQSLYNLDFDKAREQFSGYQEQH